MLLVHLRRQAVVARGGTRTTHDHRRAPARARRTTSRRSEEHVPDAVDVSACSVSGGGEPAITRCHRLVADLGGVGVDGRVGLVAIVVVAAVGGRARSRRRARCARAPGRRWSGLAERAASTTHAIGGATSGSDLQDRRDVADRDVERAGDDVLRRRRGTARSTNGDRRRARRPCGRRRRAAGRAGGARTGRR